LTLDDRTQMTDDGASGIRLFVDRGAAEAPDR
jgi:hypothetical protein